MFKSLFYIHHANHKTNLLYGFHIVIIIINLVAIALDFLSQKFTNTTIELSIIILLLLNLWLLQKYNHLTRSAIAFLAIPSIGLLGIIYINHFSTMSLLFVLLLPLTTMLFIGIRATFFIEVVMFFVIGALLYIEHSQNPANPLIQNPRVLYNLAYSAAIIYLFGLLYHFYILKTFQALDTANLQQKMLLSEVHHRVKNNLNIISSIVGLQAKRVKKKEREHLLKTQIRIESIAMVHEMLYKYDDFSNIDFQDYVHRLSSLILTMYNQPNIQVNIIVKHIKLPLEIMINLGIITNELITNSIKYAFENKQGTITIALKQEEDTIIYTYEDSGKGITDMNVLENTNSLGIKLVKLSVAKIEGEVTIEHQNGLKYTIRFKHDKY